MKQANTVLKWFQHAQKILLVSHQNWNIDEMAAMSVLEQYLTLEGKTVTLVNQTNVQKQSLFLSSLNKVQPSIGHKNDFVISINTRHKQVQNLHHTVQDGRLEIVVRGTEQPFSAQDISFKQSAEQFDLIVCLNTENLETIGKLYQNNKSLFQQTPIINFSHNIHTENFGKVNLIQPEKSSVCEILYNLFTQKKIPISPDMATSILTGIVYQSDGFLSGNTRANDLKIAGKLQTMGANQSMIIENLYKKKSFKDLQTLGRILNQLQVAPSHKLCWSALKQNDFQALSTSPENIGQWSDLVLRHTNKSEITCLFTEQSDQQTLVQIRGRNENIRIPNMNHVGAVQPQRFGVDVTVSKPIATAQTEILQILKQSQETKYQQEPSPLVLQVVQTKPRVQNPPKKQNTKSQTNIPFEIG